MSKRKASMAASDNNSKRPKIHTEVMQKSSFFTKLNYDVRKIIYDYLYEWLPPLAHGKYWYGYEVNDCRGLVLSCRQVNEELSEAAGRHLRIYIDEFASEFLERYDKSINLYGHISLYDGWNSLRSITLLVDASIFDEALDESTWAMGAARALQGDCGLWRYLLERPFDKVTLLFTQDNAVSADNQDDDESSKNDRIIELIRDTLNILGENIGFEWLAFQDAMDFAAEYEYQRKPDLVYPHEHRWSCEHECNESCEYHIECTHPDECDSDYCDEDCKGRCDGECECDCEGKFVSDCYIEFDCKYADDYEGDARIGPKRENYDSGEEHSFALSQWKRISDKGEWYVIQKRMIRGAGAGLDGRRIQTKQICFAWNFLPPTEKPSEILRGEKYWYTESRLRQLGLKDGIYIGAYKNYEDGWPHRYEVSANNGMVGEMGIAHPNRWTLASEEYTEFYGLMHHLSKEVATVQKVESVGIGTPVVVTEVERPDRE